MRRSSVVGQLHWSIYLRALLVLLIAAGVLAWSLWLPDPEWQRYALIAGGVVLHLVSCCCSAP